MRLYGRGFRDPRITATAASTESVTVRGDCRGNDEAWVEVAFTPEDLLQMLELINAERIAVYRATVADPGVVLADPTEGASHG